MITDPLMDSGGPRNFWRILHDVTTSDRAQHGRAYPTGMPWAQAT